MYQGDSFFTLSTGGQIGLAVLSGMLVFLAIGAVRLCRRKVAARAAAPAIGLVLWWLFLWLSPQVYYLYYQLIFEDLPWQVVIGWPPGAVRLIELLTFQGNVTLSDHGVGALGWAMILAGLPRA